VTDTLDGVDDETVARIAAFDAPLRIFFRARVRQSSDIDDLVSEVRLRLVRAVAAKRQIEDLSRFTFGIAKNVLREYGRERKRDDDIAADGELRGADGGTTGDRPDTLESNDRLIALDSCLGDLSDDDRALISAFYADSEDQVAERAQLAERCGLSLNALYIRASRIRRRLRECVEARMKRNS
jgi:RNA polymerase sigma factor (sigma-70 family)